MWLIQDLDTSLGSKNLGSNLVIFPVFSCWESNFERQTCSYQRKMIHPAIYHSCYRCGLVKPIFGGRIFIAILFQWWNPIPNVDTGYITEDADSFTHQEVQVHWGKISPHHQLKKDPRDRCHLESLQTWQLHKTSPWRLPHSGQRCVRKIEPLGRTEIGTNLLGARDSTDSTKC